MHHIEDALQLVCRLTDDERAADIGLVSFHDAAIGRDPVARVGTVANLCGGASDRSADALAIRHMSIASWNGWHGELVACMTGLPPCPVALCRVVV